MTCETDITKLTDWAAIVIAILAFLAACWQAREARKQATLNQEHNKISTLPILVHHENWDSRQDGMTYDLIIKNVGVGVALIKDRYFTYKKSRFVPKAQGRVVQELCTMIFQQIIPYKVISTGVFGESAKIPPGASFSLLRIFFPNPHPNLQEVVETLASDFSFEVEYESVYKESFQFSTDE